MAKEQTTNGNGNKPTVEFEKVENTFAEPWKPAAPGESIMGLYVGFQDVTTLDKKGDKKEFRAYHLRTVDGEKWSVTGAGLATIMAQIPRKTTVKMTYMGTERKGAGDMKVFEVQVPKGTIRLDPFAESDDD